MNNLVCGHGINDADYAVKPVINGKRALCPFYEKWVSMMKRAYSDKCHAHQPTYKGVTVCSQWLTFSNFKSWMEKQNWQGNHLDKDIINPGNKEYSPEKCCFVSRGINALMIRCSARKRTYMLGVNFRKKTGRYLSQCNDTNGRKVFLGSFPTELEAHIAYVKFKTILINRIANQQTDTRIRDGLRMYVRLLNKDVHACTVRGCHNKTDYDGPCDECCPF